MNGRPFRIAAVGLGAALVASIVAGFSHFRTESRILAQAKARKTAVPVSTIAAASPAPPTPKADVDPLPLPVLNSRDVLAETLPVARPRLPNQRPSTSVVSSIRRKKEFVELPPPPEFLDEPEPAEQLANAPLSVTRPGGADDPRLLAEIERLRNDFERLTRQQKLEREIERDRHARELDSLTTERRLAELKSSIDDLKALRADQRIAMLQEEPPTGVLERPVPPAGEEGAEPPVADQLEFRFERTSLQTALAEVGRRGSMNLVISPEVDGVVTAAWKNVTPQEALDALRVAHSLSVEPQGSFLLVSTSKETRGRAEISKNTLVQMFRPVYISGRDLRPLIEPLLTPEIGRIAVTLPQSAKRLGRNPGGGDSLAQPDALVVVDFPEVIDVITRTIAEVDVPAPHVELEATILDVQLSGRVKDGVGSLIASGEFSNRPGVASLDDPQPTAPCDSCCQTCDLSSSEVVRKLKLWTDVKLVSNARLLVLNKQPAELQVGSESLCLLPHGVTRPTASVDAGMRLFLRPFVSGDHLVRLEVSPEAVTSRSQPMNTRRETFAAVSTNVAVPNGGSLVIAGLNVDQSVAPSALFQSFGRLKKKHRDEADRALRREIVIMITPRILHDCGHGPAVPVSE